MKEPKKLRRNYFKSGYIYVDVLSILPTDLAYFFLTTECFEMVPCPVIVRLNRVSSRTIVRLNRVSSRTIVRLNRFSSRTIVRLNRLSSRIIVWLNRVSSRTIVRLNRVSSHIIVRLNRVISHILSGSTEEASHFLGIQFWAELGFYNLPSNQIRKHFIYANCADNP